MSRNFRFSSGRGIVQAPRVAAPEYIPSFFGKSVCCARLCFSGGVLTEANRRRAPNTNRAAWRGGAKLKHRAEITFVAVKIKGKNVICFYLIIRGSQLMPMQTSVPRDGRKVIAILIASMVSLGPVQAQYYGVSPPPEQSLVERFFLPVVGTAVGGIFGGVINLYGGKLIRHLSTDQPQAPAAGQQLQSPPTQSMQYNVPANNIGMTNAVYQPPPPLIPKDGGSVTGVMYVIDRLNPDYSLREIVTPQQGVAPIFASREKFAIRYTSNLPGVVVITNVDALQKTYYLGTFVIKPGMEMRFPAETNKGMVLDDNVGLETYQMLFMACLPAQFRNQPDVMKQRDKIPECGTTTQAEQTILLAQKGRTAKGTYSEALTQADGNRNVMLSIAPYERGDVTTTTFTIQHVPALVQPPFQYQPQPQPQLQPQQQFLPPMTAPAQPSQPGVTGTI